MKRKSLLSTLIVGLQNKHLIDIFCVCVCVNFFFFVYQIQSLFRTMVGFLKILIENSFSCNE